MRSVLVAAFCLVSCAALPPSPDGGGEVDAGFVTMDAGAAGSVVDAGVAGDAGSAMDAGVVDAGMFDDGGTQLVGVVGAKSGPFTRAQHGVEPDGGLYVEAHFGGDPACPDMNSPTPSRTLIVSGLQALRDGGVLTYADGLRVTLLDFDSVLTSAPVLRSTTTRATALDVQPGVSVTFTLEATFDGGSFTGRLVAPHCASLDG